MDSNTQERRLAELKSAAMTAYPETVTHEYKDALLISYPGGRPYPTADHMRTQLSVGKPMFLLPCGPYFTGEVFGFGDQLPIEPLATRGYRHGVSDCWALYRDWWRERGRVMKSYPRDWGWWRSGDPMIEQYAIHDFDCVDTEAPKEGDLVMWAFGTENHIQHTSVYLSEGLTLHHTSRRGRPLDLLSLSEVVPLDKMPGRVHSIWRPKE